MSSIIGVAAASYEGSLFSWRGEYMEEENDKLNCDLVMTSGFHCCAGSIRSISTSASGRYMACGGSDERIHIFNMKENSTLGELSAHTGAITCLDFFEDSYLLSGSDDKSICIWRTHDWMCVHILGGHKASINCVSVHPSGKLAVSVAQDNTLKVWNLVQGRIAFTRRLKGSSNLVKWLRPSGKHYMLIINNSVEVYATEDNSVVAVIEHNSRINKADFIGSDGKVVSVCEDKLLRIFNSQGELVSLLDFSSFETRIRDFSLVTVSSVLDSNTTHHVAALATSNGKILIADLDRLENQTQSVTRTPLEKALVGTFDIRAEPRLTCITAWIQSSTSKKAGKKKERKDKKLLAEQDIRNENNDSETTSISKRKGASNDSRSSIKKVRFFEKDNSIDGNSNKKKKKKK